MIAPYNHHGYSSPLWESKSTPCGHAPCWCWAPHPLLHPHPHPHPQKNITFSFVAKQACFAQKKGGKNNVVSNHNHTQGPKAEHTPSLNTSAKLFVSFSPSFLFLSVGKEKKQQSKCETNQTEGQVRGGRRRDFSKRRAEHARPCETYRDRDTHTKREIREGGEEFHHAKQASSRARARADGGGAQQHRLLIRRRPA